MVWVYQVLFYTGVEFSVGVVETVGGNGTTYSDLSPWTAYLYLDGDFIGTSPTSGKLGVNSITIPQGTGPGLRTLKISFPQDGSAHAEIDIFVCDQNGDGCEPRIGQQVVSPHEGHVLVLNEIAVPTPAHFLLIGDGFPVNPTTGKSNGTMWVDRSCGPYAPPGCVETGTLVESLVFQSSVQGSKIGQFNGGYVYLGPQNLGPKSPHHFQIYEGNKLEIDLKVTSSTS